MTPVSISPVRLFAVAVSHCPLSVQRPGCRSVVLSVPPTATRRPGSGGGGGGGGSLRPLCPPVGRLTAGNGSPLCPSGAVRIWSDTTSGGARGGHWRCWLQEQAVVVVVKASGAKFNPKFQLHFRNSFPNLSSPGIYRFIISLDYKLLENRGKLGAGIWNSLSSRDMRILE